MASTRGFRRYFIGQALSTFGDSLIPLTIAFASLQVGGAGALGLVLAANRLPIALLVLFGGVLGDRWDRRWVMVGADVLRCVSQAATGLLLVLDAAETWHLILLQTLAGVGTAAFVPAANGLVPALVPAERLQKANALLGLAANTNKVLSISAAGILVATVGPGIGPGPVDLPLVTADVHARQRTGRNPPGGPLTGGLAARAVADPRPVGVVGIQAGCGGLRRGGGPDQGGHDGQ